MTTVTTWTGRDANALRHALRMSMTGFAEHLGAARRTVAKWSSQGDKVLPRADMQAALDTVLSRATPEARARFEALRTVGTSGTAAGAARPDAGGHADTGDDADRDSDSGGDMRRRALLRGVDYQACRYGRVLNRLATLLPCLEAVRAGATGEQRQRVEVLAADLYHVVGSVLLKVGDRGPALVAAERSTHAAALSQDPVAIAASARIMTHALMSNGHDDQAVTLAAKAADSLDRGTRLASTDAVAVYGALVLRGAIAAARRDDRDTAYAMLDGATRAATCLGYDGNDRWTGFGAVNVLLHQVNIALALGDAGTAIAVARTVALDKVTLVERRASLYVDVARAYTQWGRYEHGLGALRIAYEVAPEEIRCRPAVQGIASDLAILATGSIRTAAINFAQSAGIAL